MKSLLQHATATSRHNLLPGTIASYIQFVQLDAAMVVATITVTDI